MNPRTLLPALVLGLAASAGCASSPVVIGWRPTADSGNKLPPNPDTSGARAATPNGTPTPAGNGGTAPGGGVSSPPPPIQTGVRPAGFNTPSATPAVPNVPTVAVPPLPAVPPAPPVTSLPPVVTPTPAPNPNPTPNPNPNPSPNPNPNPTQPVAGQTPAGPHVAGSPPGLLDQHIRGFPTAAGAILNLAPGEVPADRVLELARQLELSNNANRVLLDRVKGLEAAGLAREQALNEAIRDVETATTEVARARAELQALRSEIAALKAKLAQVEKEDVELLKAVIAALEKLLAPPRRREAP